MTTAYTSLLGLALPVTGELSGTWGDTVNNSITSLLDSAVSGTTTISVDADITLSTTTGAANEAREAILLWTAGGTITRNITAPAQSKTYIVINKSSSTQSIVLRGVGPTTGVTIIKGESAVCAWNGSDFVKVSNISGAGVFSSITNTGLTSGRVVYSTTGGLETNSANLLYSGTDLTVYGLTVGRGAGAIASNTVVGAGSALGANTTGTGNSIYGAFAGAAITTGTNNTGIGYGALGAVSTNGSNTAVGYSALQKNTGSNNVAVGDYSQFETLGGTDNTSIGSNALRNTSTGSYNTALGDRALYNTTTASNNTAVGYQAGYTQTTAAGNAFYGYQSGYGVTTGSKNIIIGSYQGSAAPISATGSNFVVLSDGDGNVRQYGDSTGNMYIAAGNLWVYAPAPTAPSGAVTLTAAQLATDIINTTGTTYTVTLPLASAIDTAYPAAGTSMGLDFHIVNTATGVITIAVNTGITSVGLLTVSAATSAHFRLRRTAAATYVLYRLS